MNLLHHGAPFGPDRPNHSSQECMILLFWDPNLQFKRPWYRFVFLSAHNHQGNNNHANLNIISKPINWVYKSMHNICYIHIAQRNYTKPLQEFTYHYIRPMQEFSHQLHLSSNGCAVDPVGECHDRLNLLHNTCHSWQQTIRRHRRPWQQNAQRLREQYDCVIETTYTFTFSIWNELQYTKYHLCSSLPVLLWSNAWLQLGGL